MSSTESGSLDEFLALALRVSAVSDEMSSVCRNKQLSELRKASFPDAAHLALGAGRTADIGCAAVRHFVEKDLFAESDAGLCASVPEAGGARRDALERVPDRTEALLAVVLLAPLLRTVPHPLRTQDTAIRHEQLIDGRSTPTRVVVSILLAMNRTCRAQVCGSQFRLFELVAFLSFHAGVRMSRNILGAPAAVLYDSWKRIPHPRRLGEFYAGFSALRSFGSKLLETQVMWGTNDCFHIGDICEIYKMHLMASRAEGESALRVGDIEERWESAFFNPK